MRQYKKISGELVKLPPSSPPNNHPTLLAYPFSSITTFEKVRQPSVLSVELVGRMRSWHLISTNQNVCIHQLPHKPSHIVSVNADGAIGRWYGVCPFCLLLFVLSSQIRWGGGEVSGFVGHVQRVERAVGDPGCTLVGRGWVFDAIFVVVTRIWEVILDLSERCNCTWRERYILLSKTAMENVYVTFLENIRWRGVSSNACGIATAKRKLRVKQTYGGM